MAGRKEERQSLTVWIPKSVVETAEELAELGQITRTKLLSNMVEAYVNELNNARKISFVHFALLFRDLGEKLKRVKHNE